MNTVDEDLCRVVIISRRIFLEGQIFQTKVLKKTNTHCMFSKFFSKIVPFWDMEKYGRPRQSTDANIMLRRKYEIFLPDDKGNNKNTHSKYVIFIAFPRHQLLREYA